MTQDHVGASGIVHKRYYQEIERGLANPSLDVLFAISRLFDVPPAALLDMDRPPDVDGLLERQAPKKMNWTANAAGQRRIARVVEDRKLRSDARRQKRERKSRK